MSDFNLLAATRTLETSMAYVLYRFLLSFTVGLGYLMASLAAAGTLVGFAFLAKNAGAVGPFGAALGFAGFGYLMYKFRGTWLRAVKAPHLALLAAQLKGETLPTGKALIDFAKQRANERFPSARPLFETDQAIQQALADIPATDSVTRAIGHPRLKAWASKALGFLYSRNHQSILGWHCYSGGADLKLSALGALAVQRQHYGILLKYRIYATVFEVLGFIAAFPLLSIAFTEMVSGIPIAFGIWPEVFGGVFAWTLKAAFFEPIAEAAMMQAFFPLAEQGADPGQAAELSKESEAYRSLRQTAT
jgi:hypothetical protein